MLTKSVLNCSGHTLENIFKCYFFEGIENIYNDTHVDRRENKKLYNYQAKKMCTFCSVVSYLLLFCDKFPDSQSSNDYYKYQKETNKMMHSAVKDATEFLKVNAPDIVGDGCKMSVVKFVDAMNKMMKTGKLNEKNHPLGMTCVLTKIFKQVK